MIDALIVLTSARHEPDVCRIALAFAACSAKPAWRCITAATLPSAMILARCCLGDMQCPR